MLAAVGAQVRVRAGAARAPQVLELGGAWARPAAVALRAPAAHPAVLDAPHRQQQQQQRRWLSNKRRFKDMSDDEKQRARRGQRSKRSREFYQPLVRQTVVVLANGATKIMDAVHPATWPKWVLGSDPTNHVNFASPKQLEKMKSEEADDGGRAARRAMIQRTSRG